MNEPRALPEAPVYKPVEYDSSRDAPEVKVPQSLPVAQVHKSEDYDASRLVDSKVKEPRALLVAPVYKPVEYDSTRDEILRKIPTRLKNHGCYRWRKCTNQKATTHHVMRLPGG